MKQKYVVMIMSAGIVILLLLSVANTLTKDRKAPTITIPDKKITYTQGESTDKLLEGVKAWDDVDKDLTDELRVDSVIPDEDETTAVVTYAVYDSSNNVTKKKRIVNYSISSGTQTGRQTEEDGGETDSE
jgi:hypothetical protein